MSDKCVEDGDEIADVIFFYLEEFNSFFCVPCPYFNSFLKFPNPKLSYRQTSGPRPKNHKVLKRGKGEKEKREEHLRFSRMRHPTLIYVSLQIHLSANANIRRLRNDENGTFGHPHLSSRLRSRAKLSSHKRLRGSECDASAEMGLGLVGSAEGTYDLELAIAFTALNPSYIVG